MQVQNGWMHTDRHALSREACFVCEKCGHEEMVPSQLGHLEEPLVCENPTCREKWTMKMVHNRSTFHNKQIVKMQVDKTACHAPVACSSNLTSRSCVGEGNTRRREPLIPLWSVIQENPNAIPEGETPHNVTLLCYDPLVDVTKPGDRITVTGVAPQHLSNLPIG